MSQSALRPEFVEFIPEKLNEGTLYLSRRYRTASHLCCCGCRLEVVTPLNPAKWRLIEHPDGKVSLYPSIGNWSFPCKSHYFVMKNCIQWAGALLPEQIAIVQSRDQFDAVVHTPSRWTRFSDTLQRGWEDAMAALKKAMKG
jgi:hypothetical protein